MSKNGSTNITPRLGAAVLYTLTAEDARLIIQQRRQAGHAAKTGNDPREGDTYPGIIVRDFAVHGEELEAAVRKTTQGWLDARPDGSVTDVQIADYEKNLRAAWGVGHGTAGALAASVNLQVFLDGNDAYWATSRSEFDPEKHGRWVQVVNGVDHELPPGAIGEGLGKVPSDHSDLAFRPDPRGRWVFTATPGVSAVRRSIHEDGWTQVVI